MKKFDFKVVIVAVILIVLGTSGYFYIAKKYPGLIAKEGQSTKDRGHGYKNISISNLSDKNALFDLLYHRADINELNKKEDRDHYNIAIKEGRMVSSRKELVDSDDPAKKSSYYETVLTAYSFRGVKTFKKDGEDRFLVIFSVKDADYLDCAICADNVLDLFLFKKVGNKYVLTAKTGKYGILNGTANGGATGVSDVTYEYVINNDPIDLGENVKGYIIDFDGHGSAFNYTKAVIIFFDEDREKILEDDNINTMESIRGGLRPHTDFDSFYRLDKNAKTHNGLYDLHVYSVGTDLDDNDHAISKDFHYTYAFDGEKYKLTSKETNKYSYNTNYEGYTKYHSSIDEGGYAPIPYASFLKALNDPDADMSYWLNYGVRFYKPDQKTGDYFSWKIKGIKVFGLNVVGLERGVCDISGIDACGFAGYTSMIFDEPLELVHQKLKENTYKDYDNAKNDPDDTLPTLYRIDYQGKKRTALVWPMPEAG